MATLGPYRALALDSLSFSLSAGILACWVRPRQAPPCAAAPGPSPWEITWEGVSTVFGNPVLRTLVLSAGWLASRWSPRDWPRRTPARWAAGRLPSAC